MSFAQQYLAQTQQVVEQLDATSLERFVEALCDVRERGGRVFVLGLGGSAANAEHCVNDLRVRAGIEAYTPGIAEWTARANDEAWETALRGYLADVLEDIDAVLVLSGSGLSAPLVQALEWVEAETKATRLGIVGAPESPLGQRCEVAVTMPAVRMAVRAGHAEAMQAVVWHCAVAHPRLAR